MRIFGYFLVMSMLLVTGFSHGDMKRGMYWYEAPPPKEEDGAQSETFDKPTIPSREQMMRMHPKQIEVLLDEALDWAVFTQAPEDVVAYYSVQDVARRKAASFTSVTEAVLLENPELNARSQYSSTTSGRDSSRRALDDSIQATLLQHRDRYAIGFFVSSTCALCEAQRPVMHLFADRSGWSVQEIDVFQRPDLATRFGVTSTPVAILIERGSDTWRNIAIGTVPLTNLEQSIYRTIRLLQGDITPQQFFTTDLQEGGFFDPGA